MALLQKANSGDSIIRRNLEYYKIRLLIILIFTLPYLLYAQVDTLWAKTFGGFDEDHGEDVICVNRDLLIVGYTRSLGNGESDAYLIKTDSIGDTLWTRTFGGSYDDVAYSILTTNDKCYVFTGSYGTASDFDLWIVKIDSMGNLIWDKNYDVVGEETGRSITQLADGGYIICGYINFLGLDILALAFRIDSLGNKIWSRTYSIGTAGTDWFYDVKPAVDGGYLFTGRTSSYGAGGDDVWLVKTDSLGDTLWTKTFGGTSTDFGRSILLNAKNEIIIAGYTNSFGGYYQGWIIKTDSLGNELWNRLHGGDEFDYFTSIKSIDNEGYILTGWSTQNFAGNVWLVKTNSLGNVLWSRSWGGSVDDQGHSVAVIDDSTYGIVGCTNSFGAGAGDVWFLKAKESDQGIAEEHEYQHTLINLTISPSVTVSDIKIFYSLKYPAEVNLSIYDILGELQKTLYVGENNQGCYIYYWNGKNYKGESVSNGIYFLNLALRTPKRKESVTKKLMLIR